MKATLRDLRTQSEMSLQAVLDKLRVVAPGVAPIARSGIIHWERRGTRDTDVINALALVYNLPFSVVDEAAQESRRLSPEISIKVSESVILA